MFADTTFGVNKKIVLLGESFVTQTANMRSYLLVHVQNVLTHVSFLRKGAFTARVFAYERFLLRVRSVVVKKLRRVEDQFVAAVLVLALKNFLVLGILNGFGLLYNENDEISLLCWVIQAVFMTVHIVLVTCNDLH